MKRILTAVFAVMISMCVGCAADKNTMGYKQISMDEGMKIFAEGNAILVDVRRQDEYDAGHIPGAILIPNETIGEGDIPQLPDKDALILIYCRSGNRSKQAAEKLVKLDYTNIVEIGGIMDYTGEIEK